MKKTSITLSFDAEKLSAIERYMNKKGARISDELDAYLQMQYQKYVPPLVREYIESRENPSPGTNDTHDKKTGGKYESERS